MNRILVLTGCVVLAVALVFAAIASRIGAAAAGKHEARTDAAIEAQL